MLKGLGGFCGHPINQRIKIRRAKGVGMAIRIKRLNIAKNIAQNTAQGLAYEDLESPLPKIGDCRHKIARPFFKKAL